MSTHVPQIYLTKENNELVLKEGVSPDFGKHTDKRVLIIGGGVTGLTVSSTDESLRDTPADHRAERLGPPRRGLLCHRHLRQVGVPPGSHHLSDRRCPVSISASADVNATG